MEELEAGVEPVELEEDASRAVVGRPAKHLGLGQAPAQRGGQQHEEAEASLYVLAAKELEAFLAR